MKKLWLFIRGEYLFSFGILLLLLGFLWSVRTALRYFDFYSLTPVQADTQTTLSTQKANAETAEHIVSDDGAPYITDTRTVREYRGILGVYDCFDNLLETFDADLSALPPQDRTLLREGVVFPDEGEMRNFLESLNS